MTNSRVGKIILKDEYIKHFSDATVLIEAAMRRGESLSKLIVPSSKNLMAVDVKRWRAAYSAAMNVDSPNMNQLYDIYEKILIDNSLTSNIETRTLKVKQAKYMFQNVKGEANPELNALFEKQWFLDFIQHCMDSIMEGFRLADLTDMADDGNLKSCKAINKYHVKAKAGIVTKEPGDEKGTSFLDPATAMFYIPIGDADSLGLLFKAAPHVLAKNFAIGHWGNYNEKMGIPFRYVNTNANDDKRQEQLAVIMDNMGAAGWAVLNENEKVNLMSVAQTDSTKCFEGLINYLDSERAMLLLGQSATSNSSKNKGTYGSMQILQEISEDRHKSDLVFVQTVINEHLIPRLIAISPAYRSLNGYKFVWDQSIELGISDLVDYVVKLKGAGYQADEAFVTQKTGIPVKLITNTSTNQDPKKKSKDSVITAFYKNGCCDHHEPQAVALPSFRKEILRIAKAIYNSKIKGIVDLPLMKLTADYLLKAITATYKTDTDSNEQAAQILANLQENVYVFSGFKTYQFLRAATDLLTDKDGIVRSFADFKKQILLLDNSYNATYLKAEYDHAVVSSQMASQWQDIQATKDTLPLLEFDATNDNRTTDVCRSLDGIRLPVDDAFWNTYYLPLHWGERSVIRQAGSGAVTGKDVLKKAMDKAGDIKPMFQGNVGKTGVAFPASHPYYENSFKVKKAVNTAVKKLRDE